MAKLRKEDYEKLGIDLRPDSNRASERWFLGIAKGDIPQRSPIVDITAGRMREWMDAHSVKYPQYEITAIKES